MTFLDAKRLLAAFPGGPSLRFVLAASGLAEPLTIYVRAAAARRGRSAEISLLPFGTLRQHLEGPAPGTAEVFLLMPWDFVPEADWRTGVPDTRLDIDTALAGAERLAELLLRRDGARVLYLPAPIPPLLGAPEGERALVTGIEAVALQAGARLVPAEAFSLGSYFASGCPVGGGWLGTVAEAAIDSLLLPGESSAKVLVTDLDNTLWSGVIAEDGPEGISYQAEGAGYRHFVYQTFLKRLRGEGVLLAGVSRNDPDVIRPPFRGGTMPLAEGDFVALLASYEAKSAQVRKLAAELNLGLDAFVFVDDNPIELEEVKRASPEVRTLAFPLSDEGLPSLLQELNAWFGRRALTDEDRDRTAMYRRRFEGMAPAQAAGADLEEFLAGLQMELVIHDRSQGDRTRAVQLINKTNQFNVNGRRWTDAEVAGLIEAGGRLFGATLTDRTGSHGEVIACLMDRLGTVEAFVMSCRVFQRRAEHAFLGALIGAGQAPRQLRFTRTERNEPFARFLGEPAFSESGAGTWALDPAAFTTAHAGDLALVRVTWD